MWLRGNKKKEVSIAIQGENRFAKYRGFDLLEVGLHGTRQVWGLEVVLKAVFRAKS